MVSVYQIYAFSPVSIQFVEKNSRFGCQSVCRIFSTQDFSDWKPRAPIDNTKRRKKGNPEREREQSLCLDSPPPSEQIRHTPSTYPRTRITPSTPTSQRVALENLRQQLTFSDIDDVSICITEFRGNCSLPISLSYEF